MVLPSYHEDLQGRLSPAVLRITSAEERNMRLMPKGTLARVEIYVGLAAIAAMIALAGFGLVSTFAERLDPKVRACIEHNGRASFVDGKPMTHDVAVALCKRLQADGAL